MNFHIRVFFPFSKFFWINSHEYKNKLASNKQLVRIGISTVCWKTYPPNSTTMLLIIPLSIYLWLESDAVSQNMTQCLRVSDILVPAVVILVYENITLWYTTLFIMGNCGLQWEVMCFDVCFKETWTIYVIWIIHNPTFDSQHSEKICSSA